MQKTYFHLAMLFFLVLLSSCEREKGQMRIEEKKAVIEYEGTIVALGDSLTAGLGVNVEESFPSLLQKRLTENGYLFRVVNAGVSGETSSGTLSRLDWILSQKPQIVILEIGANDGLRGINTTLVEDNLRRIVQRMLDEQIVVILAGMKMVWNLGNQYTSEFNAIYPKLAEENGLIFMPFFLESVAAKPEFNQSDGIHPNGDGYRLITNDMYPYVVEAVKKYRSGG